VLYGRAMTGETTDPADPGAPHDGPESGGSSQGEAGSADPPDGPERVVAAEDRDPAVIPDSNEKADARATIVEPGGDDTSPRA